MKEPNATPPVVQPAEQLRYARLLDLLARIGLALLVASFVVYALGWLPAHVAVERLPELWTLPVVDYLQRTGAPTGWGWLALAGHGDVAGLVGIALLAGCSLPCLLALVPLYLRRGDKALAWLCIAEVAVVLLAASGLLGAGH
jgi:hypothetical protein